jgi:glycosyltransferase involved in cell wall biosynthesis
VIFKPLVSAIIPTYNRSGAVCSAIDSVLQQTYSRTEIVVVDDGSTDGTQDALKRFGNRIKLVTQENAGPGAARNHGVRICNGEVVAFLDSDDIWLPNKLERQVGLLQKLGDSVCCCLCNTELRFADGKRTSAFDVALLDPKSEEGIWTNVLKVLSNRFVLFNQSVAIPRAVLDRIGGFDESLWCMEDYDLALRLSLVGPWGFIREPLTVWNEGCSDSLSKNAQNKRSEFAKTSASICEKILTTMRNQNASKLECAWLSRRSRQMNRIAVVMGLCSSPRWDARLAGSALDFVERMREAIRGRIPWYPQMETMLVGGPEQQ